MLDRLRAHARTIVARSHAPYSGTPAGVAVGLDDGRWTAAARLENAAFPLTIPALQGAWALAALSGAQPVAVAASRPLADADRAWLVDVTGTPWDAVDPFSLRAHGLALPVLAGPLALTVPFPDATPEAALEAARRAVVPASGFPVGAVVTDVDGRTVWGANVEDPHDWTRGLCAERVALVAARAAGLGAVRRLAVACAAAPGGTPCGACRQVIAELAPEAEVVLWRGDAPADVTTPAALLPGAFSGASLGR